MLPWQKLLAREGVDLPTISAVDAAFYHHLLEWSGKDEEFLFSWFKDKFLVHYVSIDKQALGRFLYEKYFNSPSQVQVYYGEGQKFLKEVEKESSAYNSAGSLDFKNAWSTFLQQYDKINYTYSITSWLAIEAWQHDFEQLLGKLIKRNKVEEKQALILQAAYRPWKKTTLIEIQDALLEGVSASELVGKYQFLRSWSIVWFRPLTEKWVQDLAPRKSEEQEINEKQLFDLLNPTVEEEHFLKIAPYMIFFKDWRDDLRRKQAYSWNFFFTSLAKHFGIAYNDLGYLMLDEITSAIAKNSFPTDLVAKRKKYGCIVTKNFATNAIVATTDIPQRYQTIADEVEQTLNQHEIKGLTAQPGKIRGKAIIVETYHDLKKIEDGCILVANTTHPNYLPAMHKAIAFVTNEGGVVSHAAIVARELKKPCIVGTKNATKILQNGDLIEVDADNGIVRLV